MIILDTVLFLQLLSILPILVVSTINLFSRVRLPKLKANIAQKRVSVLIPARNEEDNIEQSLENALRFNLIDYEVLMLDDNSEDNTRSIAEDVKSIDSSNRLRILSGGVLPDGWLGKNWACKQLSDAASGDILVFLDADVMISSSAITNAINYFHKHNLDLLSIYPRQAVVSFGEKFTVPYLGWLLTSFLPLRIANNIQNKSFAAANGQVLIFKAESYKSIGGHSSVKQKVAEDMSIAKVFRDNKLRSHFILGNDEITCRMYNDFKSAMGGLSKNVLKILPLPFQLYLNFLIIFSVFGSLVLVFFDLKFLIILVLIILQRGITIIIQKESPIQLFLYFSQMLVILILQLQAVSGNFGKGQTWKGREV